jgi:hypothetical protein
MHQVPAASPSEPGRASLRADARATGRSARAGTPGSGPHPTPYPLRRQGYVLAPKSSTTEKAQN